PAEPPCRRATRPRRTPCAPARGRYRGPPGEDAPGKARCAGLSLPEHQSPGWVDPAPYSCAAIKHPGGQVAIPPVTDDHHYHRILEFGIEPQRRRHGARSEEHTSELQSRENLV